MQEMQKIKTNKYSKFERKKFPFAYMIIAFPVIQFAVFWVYVNASSFTLSFFNTRGEFTFKNFQDVFTGFQTVDRYGFNLREALFRSMWVWFQGTVICTPISLFFVYVLTGQIRGHYVYRICNIIPSLMGSIVCIAVNKYLFQYDGPIVKLLTEMGVDLPKEVLKNGLLGSEDTAFLTLMIYRFLMGMVTSAPVYTGAFSRIPDELFESADLDGASYFRKFYSIAVPCIWPTITSMLTFSLCSIFTSDFGAFLYTNGTGEPGLSTMGFMIFYLTNNIASSGGSNAVYGYPAALGMVLTLATMPIALGGKRFLEKLNEGVEN